MNRDLEFQFEMFEEYYGDAKQVKKLIDECKVCGGKYVFGHLSDYRNLYIQETARCPDCGTGKRKTIHIIN